MSMHFVKCVEPRTKHPLEQKSQEDLCLEGGGLSGYASSRSTNKTIPLSKTSLRILFQWSTSWWLLHYCASVSSLEPVCSLEPARWLHCLLLQGLLGRGELGEARGGTSFHERKCFTSVAKRDSCSRNEGSPSLWVRGQASEALTSCVSTVGPKAGVPGPVRVSTVTSRAWLCLSRGSTGPNGLKKSDKLYRLSQSCIYLVTFISFLCEITVNTTLFLCD